MTGRPAYFDAVRDELVAAAARCIADPGTVDLDDLDDLDDFDAGDDLDDLEDLDDADAGEGLVEPGGPDHLRTAGEDLVDPWSAHSRAVRDELVAAAVRTRGDELAARRRVRAPWLAAAVAAVALVVGIALVAVDTQSVEASGIDVIQTPTGIRIRFLDVDHTPAQLQRELDAAGIDTLVIGVPVRPEDVGEVLRVDAPVDLPNDGIRTDPEYVEIDDGWTGVLEVRVGVEPLPGEQYAQGIDLLAEGGRLHCQVAQGDAAASAATALAALEPPFEVHWYASTPQGSDELPLAAALEAPDVVVNWIVEIAPGVVNVDLRAADDLGYTLPTNC